MNRGTLISVLVLALGASGLAPAQEERNLPGLAADAELVETRSEVPKLAPAGAYAAKGDVIEYACHEGNYSLRGMLSAARAEEAAKR